MNRDNWPVNKGVRPAGPQDACLYCKAPKGGQHSQGCVMRNRSIVVRVSFDLLKFVPEDWDSDMIEFHMNGSSSCSSNLLREIVDQADRVADGCTCNFSRGAFLREATAEDEERFEKSIVEAES